MRVAGEKAMNPTLKRGADYAVFATIIGSYGETSHRQMGKSFVDPIKCALACIRHHLRGVSNVEFLNFRTGVRLTAQEIMQDPCMTTRERAVQPRDEQDWHFIH
jgi:hypothetical protein